MDGGMNMATLTETQITDSRRVFNLCDMNGDGYLDHEEFHVLLRVLDGDVSREESLLDFEAADTAGDGYIEFREFVAWWTN
jgi:Ca2+-binding EF-hand superfamily protein